jgi:hypothetical protein
MYNYIININIIEFVCSIPDQSDEEYKFIPPEKARRMQSSGSNLITKNVSDASDRNKVSDREAVYVLSATAHALGHDIQQLPLTFKKEAS